MAEMTRYRPQAIGTAKLRTSILWEEIRVDSLRPDRRSHHSAAEYKGKVYIFGGQDLREGVFSDFFALTISTGISWDDKWEVMPVDENAPGEVARHTAVVSGDRMYVFGGTDNMQEFNTIHAFDFTNHTWIKYPPTSPDLPPPIDSHTAVAFTNSDGHACMLVFGGYISGMRSNRSFIFNIETKRWSELKTNGTPPIGRSDHAAIIYNGDMYVIGGTIDDVGRTADFWKLDLATFTWSEVEQRQKFTDARSGHSAIIFNDTIVVFGGIHEITREQNDMYAYNFQTHSWAQIQFGHHVEDPVSAQDIEEFKSARLGKNRGYKRTSTYLDIPGGTAAFSSQPKRSSTYIGRNNDTTPFSAGMSPKKKRTSLYEGPVSPEKGHISGNVPHARDGHSATLVDHKMVIFGGDRHQMPFNDIYSYDLKDEVVKGKVSITN